MADIKNVQFNSNSGYQHLTFTGYTSEVSGNNWIIKPTFTVKCDSGTSLGTAATNNRGFGGTINGSTVTVSPTWFKDGQQWNGNNTYTYTTTTFTIPYDTTKNVVDVNLHVKTYGGSYTSGVGTFRSISGYTMTLVAPTYTITYNANGGSGAPSNGTKKYNVNYTISSTKPTRTGYTFLGWATSSTATSANSNYDPGDTYSTNAALTLYAVWKINSYENILSHWAWGFENQEGNNNAKTAFQIDIDTFSANYNSSVIFNESRATTIPNGFYHQKRFASQGYTLDNSWEYLDLPVTKTQPAKSTWVDYYYSPTNYTITYNLDGGTNDLSNPSSYTVLYGVSLVAPTRENYEFLGWQDQNGNIITGINEGENATFASADELYTKLATRTTGNIEVTALWKATSNTWIKQNGSWVRGLTWIKTEGTWKKGLIYLKDSGTWKQGK